MDAPDNNPPQAEGVRGTLRRLGETILTTLRNRLELFGVELQEEKAWLISTLIWAGAAIFLGGLTVVLAVISIVWLTPEPARPWVLIGLTVLFAFLSAITIASLRRQISAKPASFEATTNELKKDIQWIRSQD